MKVKDSILSDIYTAQVAEAGLFDGALLRLIMGDFVESDAIAGDEGDITIPTFTGYDDEGLSAGAVHVDEDGLSYVQFDAVEFSPTDAVNLPQAIYGCAILASDDELLAVSKFSNPVSLVHASQVLTVLPKFRLSGDSSNNIVAVVE